MNERRARAGAAWRGAAVGAGVLQAAAAVGAALWFREADVRYAAAAVVASIAALALQWRSADRDGAPAAGGGATYSFALGRFELERSAAVLFVLASLLVATPAVRLARARAAPSPTEAVEQVARAVAPTLAELERTAQEALQRVRSGERSVRGAFATLAPLGDSGGTRRGERAVAVLDAAGAPVAWAGSWRVRPDSLDLRAGRGIAASPFYVILYAVAGDARQRAVAATVLHAEPPADALARALDAGVLRESGLRGLDVRVIGAGEPPVVGPEWSVLAVPGVGARLALRAVPPAPAAVRAVLLDDARRGAAPGLALMAGLAAAAVWRLGTRTRLARLLGSAGALALPLAVLALAPLGALSNATRFFNPAVYISPVGGALTATLGALAATGAVGVLAVATAWRGAVAAGADRWQGPVRAIGGAAASLVVLAAGAWLVRALARGINPPAAGTTVGLFVGWQGAFCLVIATVLLWAAALARPLAAGAFTRRAPMRAVAGPLAAVVVAVVGAVTWTAPDGWPAWYAALWAVPALVVVFVHPGRGVIPAAIATAGLAASTLVWGATLGRQVALAERDVRALAVPDADALTLLARFGRSLAADSAPAGDAAGASLLRRYAASPLAAAGYPVALARWDVGGTASAPVVPRERVALAMWAVDSDAVAGAVRVAAATAVPVTRSIAADPGAATLLAVPQRDGRVATVTLFPRAQFASVDPLGVLLGAARARTAEPPYTLTLLHQGRTAAAPPTPPAHAHAPTPGPELRWSRSAGMAHADAGILLPDGPAAAHVEIALGSLAVLAERAALLTFADLAAVGLLWWLPSLDVARWPRTRRGWRYWTGSYRARLTGALLAFFAVPTLAFGGWTFAELKTGDRESRALLVRETLRAAVADGAPSDARALPAVAVRLGAPLLAYDHGVLVAASEPAVLALAPLGRLLPAPQAMGVGVGDEITGAAEAPAALGRALIGYRAALTPDGRRVVLATPARADEVVSDTRRRDLGFLVLLAATSGALAALWLSGVAARQLARPVGSLRRAALALAGAPGSPTAARGPVRVAAALQREPPAEFRPVFAAFQRMAVELDASQHALEAARRRTAAVLRDVASGVVAVDDAACVTVANPQAAALLGASLEVGRPLDAAVPAAVAHRVAAFLARDGAEPAREGAFEATVRGRQLRARLTALGAARGDSLDAVSPDGTGAVLTLDDVTELARAQRALAWGEMARQVAHEIKNPLTPIRLGVQLLRRAYRDGRGDFGALLETNTERVLAEIDRLDEIARAFSRYGTTPAQAAPAEVVDVAAVARDVVALERLGGGEVRWVLDGPARADAWARDGELREVVLNLLENARLAGARCVRVDVTVADETVAVVVRDDGHGIAPDVLPRIFDPHFSTRTSGSGLGLAIARRLVDGWGGRIGAESVVGAGTEVRVTLRAVADGAAGTVAGDGVQALPAPVRPA